MIEGVVNLLKPPGMTSSDAVTDIRHIFSMKRVGHTGTLDPGAAGVLPICLGRATRLFDYLVDKKKEYIAEISFGTATDTQDSYGRVTASSDVRVTRDMLENAIPAFTGNVTQIAPMFSAVRIDGRKLYELAREGADVIECERKIMIDELSVMAQTGENSFLLKMICSRGTYVRTVCNDIGASLGAASHMSFLLRIRAGNFSISDAYTLDELKTLKAEGKLDEAVTPMDEALSALPKLTLDGLDERETRLLVNGADIECDLCSGGTPLVYAGGKFIGVGAVENGLLHIKLNLMEAE